MAKRYVAGGGTPAFRSSDRVAAGWKSHRWATSGNVTPVTVRHLSKNARRKAERYAA